MTYCLPKYNFHILDATGWNFRHAVYHEENRRTLVKAYGLKFLISVTGNAGKFDVTRTVVILVTGLGLMGLANILCEIVLLKFSNQYRDDIVEKKFEQLDVERIQELKRHAEKELIHRQIKSSMKKKRTNSQERKTLEWKMERHMTNELLTDTEVNLGQNSPDTTLTGTTNTVENTPALRRKDTGSYKKRSSLKMPKNDMKTTSGLHRTKSLK